MILRILAISSILATTYSVLPVCKKSEFQCLDGLKCVPIQKFCNGVPNCLDASDEAQNCSPCNISYYGLVGQTYELEVKRPGEVPFLCHLNFTAGGGGYGELVQLSFETFSVGTFESFTNAGCPDGFISIKEANRPSTGGKWCGSAWGYTVYYSETASVNLTLALDKLPQEHSYFQRTHLVVGAHGSLKGDAVCQAMKKASKQNSGNNFEFRISYKFLKLSEARIRYGNATQRSYRGKLNVGSYCDRLLEGCSKRSCRIQSPNYPGIYPRNVSCHYRVRERNVPEGKHALIAVRQPNYHYKERVPPKFDNSDKLLKIWDQCNMMQDYIEILDGWNPQSTTLAHLCSGETIPEMISSGAELLLKFHTSPFGNPFHPLPLSYLPGFELEVEVFFVNKESPTYIGPSGKKCEFHVTSSENSSGLLESPLHSLPPNTTCQYHFKGQPKDIVWISFMKYHVTNERLTDFNTGECDVQLQIWDGDIKSSKNSVQLIGQFCKDDKPKLCSHTLLKNSTRLTRPCRLNEGYVSTSSDLTLSHSIKYGSVLYPVNFVLRYEFVDLSQEGIPMSRNPCDRLFKSQNGRFYSPKIPFLFGRGGQRDLTCIYQFESKESQRFKLTINKAQFGSKECQSDYNAEINRWQCSPQSETDSIAQLTISEYPWKDVEIIRDCLCSNVSSQPFTITTKTASKIVVKFTITNMKNNEDYHDYFFDANFEFVASENCLNPWKNRRLKGSSGEITIRNNEQSLRQTEEFLSHNHTKRYCLQQPWLIEPEEDCNFIYLKIKGTDRRDSRLCPSKNRILIYEAGHTQDVHVICPYQNHMEDIVEMFSEGWTKINYKKLPFRNSRSFIIEFLRRETGNFAVTWMEVSKNPAVALPSSMLMIRPPDCPHSCPELGACISPELWCDGLRHCPSGNDERESNCVIGLGFPYNYLNSAALSAVGIVILSTLVITLFVIFKNWRHEQKNVIVSVTEHTFLEFKSGLC